MAITRVTTDGITDSAVSTAKIGANAVDTTKIGADVIVADDIADNAITVAQIQDGAITSAKLNSAALNPITLDTSNNRAYINRTAQSTSHDAFVVSSPAGGVGGGNSRVSATITAEDLTGDSGTHANAFLVTKSKGNYYSGLEISSTSGHVGGWIGHWNGSSSDRQLQARVGGTGINASDALAMQITSAGYVKQPSQPSFMVYGAWSYASSTYIWKGFANIDHNIGNHWNNTIGRFTAPVAGRYMIYATAHHSAVGSYHLWAFLKNGSLGGGNWVQSYDANGGNDTTSKTQVWNLAAGDYLEVASNGTYANGYTGGYITVGGHLVG